MPGSAELTDDRRVEGTQRKRRNEAIPGKQSLFFFFAAVFTSKGLYNAFFQPSKHTSQTNVSTEEVYDRRNHHETKQLLLSDRTRLAARASHFELIQYRRDWKVAEREARVFVRPDSL